MRSRGSEESAMALKTEQLTRNCRGWKIRRWVKRQTSRKLRRLAKRLLQDAPVRVTKGWAD